MKNTPLQLITNPSTSSPSSKTSTHEEKQRIHFALLAEPGNQIYLTGSFNKWSPDSVKMEDIGDGRYQQSLQLPKGRHEYKFVVNNTWMADPDCHNWQPNKHGSLNSVLNVAS